MTIRKSKPERRRERDRDVNNRHHRHRSNHSYRNSVEYWRQAEFRGYSSRNSQRHCGNTSSSSSSSKSGSSIQDSYPYSENYGWQRNTSQSGESEADVSQDMSLWHEDPEVYADKNNSDDEYRKSYHYNSEEDYEFARRLREEKGYEICCMAEDGACLFRAVAHHIFGDSAMHEEIRRLTIDYISLNRDYFSQFITEDFDRYVERKRKSDCYGNHVELQAISEMYNRPLEIYRYSTKPQLLTPQIEPTNPELSPIRLSYHQGGHYNAVIDPYKATIGVGLGLPGHQPGAADRLQVDVAKKESELLELEEAMLKDKLKETNYEAVQEQIEKQVAAESFIEWFTKKGASGGSGGSGGGGGCSVSGAPDATVGPSRSPNTSELRCKVKKSPCGSASPPAGAGFGAQASPHSPHAAQAQASAAKASAHAGPSGTGGGGGKRRSSRNSPPTGACSPSAYGAAAAALRASPVQPGASDSWAGCHAGPFDETASLMNGSIPVELKEWDDFVLHQVLIESQREYLLAISRNRSRRQSGEGAADDPNSGGAGCSKD